MNKMNKKGFTLIEMLVVIAIIAILVSIVIPVVGDSTAKAKAAKDAANIRAAITEVTAEGVGGTTTITKNVDVTCGGNWAGVSDIAGITPTDITITGNKVAVVYNPTSGDVTVGGQTVSGD